MESSRAEESIEVTTTQAKEDIISAKRTSTQLPLPDVNHPFEKQINVLETCVTASDRGQKDVDTSTILSIYNSKTVLSTIGFLKSIGLLIGERGKCRPTTEALDIYYSRKEGNTINEKAALRKVVLKTWFWNSTRLVLDARKNLNENELIVKLARDSNADPDKRKRALRSLIDYMNASDLIIEEEGNFRINENVVSQEVRMPESRPQSISEEQQEPDVPIEVPVKNTKSTIAVTKIGTISININLNAEMTEDQIRTAIRAVVEELQRANTV